MNVSHSPINRLRFLGFLEGLSLLVLLLIAMPMKYLAGEPIYVRIVGSFHGVFFVLFLLQLYWVAEEREWNYKDLPLKLFISCFIPFGTFYLDHTRLKKMT